MNNTFIINKILFLILLSGYVYSQNCCEALEIAENECNGNTGCYIPQCTSDCNWEPMQCWGSTGYCWCVDEDGLEIENTSTPSWQGFPDCEEHTNECEPGYLNINNLCFHEGDFNVIQKMINNSYESGIDLGCNGSPYCGSPNPYMDSSDSWMWIGVDGEYYEWNANENGVVEPLELGIQEWENGRLTSLMCGAYIYCQLSGPIPDEIIELTEIETLRLEYNYLSGFIPDGICDLGTNHLDYLAFDLSGNSLCPPYPECIDTDEESYWFQDTLSCNEIGDLNSDFIINVQDLVIIIHFILNPNSYNYQDLIISDINSDGVLNVTDAVQLVNIILN
jgi:hypothetical protein